MIKHLFLLILFCGSAQAQNMRNPNAPLNPTVFNYLSQDYGLAGPVMKTVTTTTTDDGTDVNTVIFDEKGKLVSDDSEYEPLKMEYAENEIIVKTKNGNRHHLVQNGNIVKTTYEDGAFKEYKYDSNNNLTEIIYNGTDYSEKVIFKYDDQNRVIEKTSYWDDKFQNTIDYRYFGETDDLQVEQSDKEDSTRRATYYYSNGAYQNVYHDVLGQKSMSNVKYDKYGNWISYSDERFGGEVTREIIYF
ncbi:hypothetical protein [Nonlabens spongiae]|nr:hypothetical protein [Nonlabens spongiae]